MRKESEESIMDGHGGSYHYSGSGKRQVNKGRNASALRKSFRFFPEGLSFGGFVLICMSFAISDLKRLK